MVKIMQSLGLNYKPAVDSTEQFKESVKSLNKDMAYFKSNAIETAKSINKAFTAEFGNLRAQDIKKIFDQIDKYNKPVEIKVVTDKAEIVMEKFSKDMGIKLDKNLRKKLKEGGLEWTKRFSWDKTAEKTIDVLKGVCKK